MTNSNLGYTNYLCADLDSVVFEDINFTKSKFDYLDLTKVSIYNCDMTGATFQNTNLSGTIYKPNHYCPK